ncbi:MAG TPA: IPT/TIG domain-containing protein [Candidatus Methylomirabilis sp.]
MPHGPGCRAVCLLAVLLLLFGLSPPSSAQQITYQYDALGRLILVSTPEGIAQYEYDAVGNILRITTHRYADVSGPVAILGMSPTQGAPGTTVQIYGRGFGLTPADNQIAFNGTPATVTAASASSLTVTVPAGATTGPIALTAPLGTATSPHPFTILQSFAVVPDQADVALGASVGFRVTLDGTPTTAVKWRVNGTEGGSVQTGTVTSAGVYTAPTTPPPVEPVTVEAVLTADPAQGAIATVRVGQASGQLSAAPVTVARPAANPGQAVAGPVTVARAPSQPGDAFSGAVTVAPAPSQTALAVTSPLSVTGRPIVSGVAPTGGTPGSVVSVTLTGANLQGAAAIQALRNGVADTTVTTTAVVAVPDGTSLTCTLTIGASAPLGARVLQVVTPQGRSIHYDLGANTFTVRSP